MTPYHPYTHIGGMITAMMAPNSASGRAILFSLSRTKADVERRSNTRWAKNPASRKNVGIRHVWMNSNTRNSRVDWSSSAGQMDSNPAMREK